MEKEKQLDDMLEFGNTRREIVKRAKEIIQEEREAWTEERGRMAKLLNEFEVHSW